MVNRLRFLHLHSTLNVTTDQRQVNHFEPQLQAANLHSGAPACDLGKTLSLRRGNLLALTHEGGSVVAGAGLHRAAAVRVASRQRLGDGRRGLAAGVARPAQNELQCGSLRKRFERRQSLQGGGAGGGETNDGRSVGWSVGHTVERRTLKRRFTL